jgi:hypothetical protein
MASWDQYVVRVATAALLAACGLTDPPLAWEAPRTVTGVQGDTTPSVRPDGRLARGDTLGLAPGTTAADTSPAATHDAAGHAGGAILGATARGTAPAVDHAAMGHAMPPAGGDVAPAAPIAEMPTPANSCGLRRATDTRGITWAAWWRIRPDQSALLEVAQGVAGDTTRWARRWVVDTLDRATTGCERPAPAIAVDSRNGYVHVAYWSQAAEGPGLFYAHLMDPRASAFEPATALVYGEVPARVALASRGDTLAIAYEDPNSERGHIALHLSLTSGHLFEQVARIVRVNPGQQPASDPQVALGGGKVWVAWKETSPRGDAFVVRGARIVRR